MIVFDAHNVAALAADLPRLGYKAARVIDGVLAEGAADLEKTWRRNAEQTSGQHGKWYPRSIDHERIPSTSLAFEVGPNPSKRQGRMQFEEGSVNQPPHLDGQKAADEVVPQIGRRVDTALGLLGF